ncbi:tripartite motif-containing protein 60-like [Hyla sarda]|uniref:tripartite motif-containing protein 60-like n=1 Tax=Hyla sarda TaxID=327740 RepID=UPI0024C3179F|nr:tripartite motif-containing protein 60-like [Hyla sarda]
MATIDLREELSCSICMNVFTDPVTLPCGHNFCQVCISRTWDNQTEGEHTCPECMERFSKRPQVRRNLRMSNIAKSFLYTEDKQEEYGVFCTYCIYSYVPAVKSCLMCEASLCNGHLRVHSRSAHHTLDDLLISSGRKMCSVHKQLLDYYCFQDSCCICASCLENKHKDHQVEPLEKALAKKKEEFKEVLTTLTRRQEEIDGQLSELHEKMNELRDKAILITNGVRSIFEEVKKTLKALKKQMMNEIRVSEEKALLCISDLIHHLKAEMDELCSKKFHMSELAIKTDPLTVLQHSTDNLISETMKVLSNGCHGNVDDEMDLDEDRLLEILKTGLSDIVTSIKGRITLVTADNLLLDVNMAANNVHISRDLKTICWTVEHQDYPESSERFQTCQTLSTQNFIKGQHCWEVETSETGNWIIGAAYPSIKRDKRLSYVGNNDKSWGLKRHNNIYVLKHNQVKIPLSGVRCQKFRIFLDYEAGQLSFYELQDPEVHLHTFSTTFNEPLHAAFWVWNGWVRIKD